MLLLSQKSLQVSMPKAFVPSVGPVTGEDYTRESPLPPSAENGGSEPIFNARSCSSK